jgi:hypothetical protein
MNLDCQATAYWSKGGVRNDRPPVKSDRRNFETLREAVRFVMEDLDDFGRLSAFIETDVEPRHHTIKQIEEIFKSAAFKDG